MKKLNYLLVALMFLASYLLLPRLPANIPIHWNLYGEIDSVMEKGIAVWFMPVLALIMLVFYQILPLLDPRAKNYKLFQREWHFIQSIIIGFLAYMQFLTFHIALNPVAPFLKLMFAGLGTMFILLGINLKNIRQNYFIGIRLPWTLADEKNWKMTHLFASRCFIVAGVITLIESFFLWQAPLIIFSGILSAALLPTIYSFILFKKGDR